MKAVWKYVLDVHSGPGRDVVELRVPFGATFIHFDRQGDEFCVWALVDPNQWKVTRRIRVAGTGHAITEEIVGQGHIGSTLMQGGALVFHAFEVA